MLTLLVLLFIVGLLLYAKLRWHYSYWSRRGVAGERPVYFRGNMSGLGRDLHWTDINLRIYRKFRGVERYCGYFTFMTKSLFIMDLELIRDIMIRDFSSFADRGLFHNVRDDPLTGNLLFLDGPEWRWLRQNLTQVFTSGKMKFMFPNMVEVGEKLTQACRLQVGEIEAKDLCARFTTDVIGSCAFGLECNSLQDPESEFRRMGRSVTKEPLHSLLVQAFMFAQPELARKLRFRLFRPESQIPDSNLIREPEFKIIIPVHSIHHDPELYPDPEKFDPSRFEPEEIKARHPFAYLPFGEGPRNCIGERFGKLQVKVGLVYLLRDFRFSMSEKTQIPLKFSSQTFLISTQEGVHLRMDGLARP
ncbi:GD10575 [Drosophila simulans]|uniref:GD10575 n=1 Tax=Drosophila simulans TaxID=7240 RepID=B4QFU1_DROSI|nr:GD10575 [Drosophila simulans]